MFLSSCFVCVWVHVHPVCLAFALPVGTCECSGVCRLYLAAGQDTFDVTRDYLDRNGFSSTSTENYNGTFIFNTFVMCQVRFMS